MFLSLETVFSVRNMIFQNHIGVFFTVIRLQNVLTASGFHPARPSHLSSLYYHCAPCHHCPHHPITDVVVAVALWHVNMTAFALRENEREQERKRVSESEQE